MAKTKQLPYKPDKQQLLNSIQSLKESLVKHQNKQTVSAWIKEQIELKEKELNRHYQI
jgi:hypothetical protein